jgi:hypothetical protein
MTVETIKQTHLSPYVVLSFHKIHSFLCLREKKCRISIICLLLTAIWAIAARQHKHSSEKKKFLYIESPRMKEKLHPLLPSYARCFPFRKLESPGLVRWVVLVCGWLWGGNVVKVCVCLCVCVCVCVVGGDGGFSDLPGTTTCCRALE